MVQEREEALAAHKLAKTQMANRRQSRFTPFKEGQKVWLDNQNIKTDYHRKITPKCEGPFQIEEVLGPVTYQLKLPKHWKIHNVFHATLLRPYLENEIYENNYPRPPAKLPEREQVYEVERIVKHRRRGRGYQYYIKWKGYPENKATWEMSWHFPKMAACSKNINSKNNSETPRLNNMPSMQISCSMPNLKVK